MYLIRIFENGEVKSIETKPDIHSALSLIETLVYNGRKVDLSECKVILDLS